MKNRFGIALALVMALVMAFSSAALADVDAAQEFDPDAHIAALAGSYTELFATIAAPDMDEKWLEK